MEYLTADHLHIELTAIHNRILAHPYGQSAPGSGLHLDRPDSSPLLDPDQARAAAHFYGPARVLAPAGSGKTRTLTARIVNLVQAGIDPKKILALAFNQKAAEEMRIRLEALGIMDVHTRTFHSLGYELLREAYDWRFEGEAVAGKLEEELGSHLQVNFPGVTLDAEFLQQLYEEIQKAKETLKPFKEMRFRFKKKVLPFGIVFQRFTARQRELGLITFADMVYFVLRVLIEEKEFRDRQQKKYEFLLVDEFQDLNHSQMLFLMILAAPHRNLFVVGDDDQMIYSWRGAEIEHILDFDKMYPGAKSIILQTNYRSTRAVIRHSRWLIEKNPIRVAKEIQAGPKAAGGEIFIAPANSLDGQIQDAVRWMISTRNAGDCPWDQFAVLVRVNEHIPRLQAGCHAQRIPAIVFEESELEASLALDNQDQEGVAILTIHKSKGKEFRFVVLFDLSARSQGASVEEERRLAYVGLTRAETALLITTDQEKPSPFLKELALNPEFDDFSQPYLRRRVRLENGLIRWRRLFSTHLQRICKPGQPDSLPAVRGPIPFRIYGYAHRAVTRIEKRNSQAEERIQLLEMELQFREILEVKDHLGVPP